MSKARQKGTAAETAVVKYLQERGYTWAERRALAGVLDKGDITGIPGVVFEVKDCAKVELAKWVDELKAEMINAKVSTGTVVRKRRGTMDVGEWFAILPFRLYVDLLQRSNSTNSAQGLP